MLRRESGSPLDHRGTAEVWPSFFLFAGLALLVMVKVRWFPKLARILQSTFSRQVQQQLEREEIDPFRFYWVSLNLLLLLNLAFVSWKLNALHRLVFDGVPSSVQFVFFLLIITGAFVLKYLLNHAVGVVSGRRDLMTSYSVNSALVNHTLGIVVFPCAILAQFGPLDPRVFLYAALILCCVALVVRWYRGLRKGLLEERIGIMQIFSYFCALEILPVLVLVKYLVVTF